MNSIYRTPCVDPYVNLAAEELLFLRGNAGGAILYLWQNQNTVVIGRNQNAWSECRMALLEGEGGRLARRTTGGGAVYHDLGNLNFSFLLPREAYDVSRQLSVIIRAVGEFGILAEASGRNDVTLAGGAEKFSGNAFRFSKSMVLHHGTLLVNADLDRLGRYLAPPAQKFEAKGICSVRSRVVNLSSIRPALSVPALSEALCRAFIDEYGPAEERPLSAALDAGEWENARARFASDAWRLGRSPDFDVMVSAQLPLGFMELHLSMSEGLVSDCAVYSDAMDPALPERLRAAFLGCPFSPAALAERALASSGDADMAAWLRGLEL